MKFDLPENATDAQKAEWRKENGIPDSPEGYEVKLPDGIVVGESDKPLVADYQKFAHATGMSPADFNKTLGFYYQLQNQQLAAQATADVGFHDNAVATLTQEWGGQEQYTRNTNIIGNFMASVPQEFQADLLAARTPDGRKLGDQPQFLKWAAEMGRMVNPAATLMPNSNNPPAAVNARHAEIKAWMSAAEGSEDWKKYWKSDAVQAEYRELISAQQAHGGRAA
ncbi:MAG: hypothetical protein V4673_14530 [Pseudomonadota bacterium]